MESKAVGKPTLYIESSVVSYYTANPSRDFMVMAHQTLTHLLWEKHLHEYDVRISEFVLREIARGDAEAGASRLAAVSRFPVLPVLPEVETLATAYSADLHLPENAFYDALHIAVASVHGIDFLVTWNCKHIANAHLRRRLAEINMREGVMTPIICTPEELLDDDSIPPPGL